MALGSVFELAAWDHDALWALTPDPGSKDSDAVVTMAPGGLWSSSHPRDPEDDFDIDVDLGS
ncbi:MAG: hypothetical protein ABIJ09_16260 [Pseudomonadota bacterium]